MKALYLAAMFATVLPPTPRSEPSKIDISKMPLVELLTTSGATIVIETNGADGQIVEMHSDDRQFARILAFEWKKRPMVETTLVRGDTVTTLLDNDGDGLPDVRTVYQTRGSDRKLVSSERLHWTGSSIEDHIEEARK